jgi:hypothetical protein
MSGDIAISKPKIIANIPNPSIISSIPIRVSLPSFSLRKVYHTAPDNSIEAEQKSSIEE